MWLTIAICLSAISGMKNPDPERTSGSATHFARIHRKISKMLGTIIVPGTAFRAAYLHKNLCSGQIVPYPPIPEKSIDPNDREQLERFQEINNIRGNSWSNRIRNKYQPWKNQNNPDPQEQEVNEF